MRAGWANTRFFWTRDSPKDGAGAGGRVGVPEARLPNPALAAHELLEGGDDVADGLAPCGGDDLALHIL